MPVVVSGDSEVFDQFAGVVSTEVGYANGPDHRNGHSPTYEEVCRSSGHAETVKIIYDEKGVSLSELLPVLFHGHRSGLCEQAGE